MQMARRTPTYAVTEYMTPDELIVDDGFGGSVRSPRLV